jgi:hypothetical protein
MHERILACLLLAAGLLPAAQKTEATAMGENQCVALTVTLYIDAAGVQDLIGDGLGGHYIVARVKVEPKYGKEVNVERDSFVLRTDKDGERATPYSPSQIAGGGALVVREVKRDRGPGPPSGGGGDNTVPTGVTLQNGDADKQNPLKQTLADKELPEKKTNQPYSGLLYFAMEKQKMKDLELTYNGKEGRIVLNFK